MRSFKLWNYDKTASVDLNNPNNFAYNWQGLGLDYDLTFADTSDNSYLNNKKSSRKDIKCTVLFQNNSYQNYENFLSFLTANGYKNLVLEYNNGISTKCCDVFLKTLPAVEKSEYNVIECEITFTPNKGWYIEVIETKTTTLVTGVGQRASFQIDYSSGDNKPFNIKIFNTLGFLYPEIYYFKDSSAAINCYIKFPDLIMLNDTNEYLYIDSINKKITHYYNNNGYKEDNAYSLTDKTGNYKSFIVIPPDSLPAGKYYRIFITSKDAASKVASVTMTYRRYL